MSFHSLCLSISWTSPVFWLLTFLLVIIPMVMWIAWIVISAQQYDWTIKLWFWPFNLVLQSLTISPLTTWFLLSLGHIKAGLFPDPNTNFLSMLFTHMVISPGLWALISYLNISCSGIFIKQHADVMRYRKFHLIYFCSLYLLGFTMLMVPLSPWWNPV